jgi:glycosyltransferase involved in cell wall biosynthesis
MTLLYRTDRVDPRFVRSLDVEIVVPVFNEERELERNIRRLRDYLDECFPFHSLVTIADNASTDATTAIARRLASEIAGVRATRIDEKGRGRALRTTWLKSEAAVVCYMDVDLSTDLDAVLPLVAPLLSGHSDIAIGTRLAVGSRVVRGPKREFVSRAYNLLVRTVLRSKFTDAQCGFKAMSREAAQVLLPLVADNGWFFDTEVLVLAQRNGLRIHEVAVDWIEDRDSSVEIAATARDDLRGIVRLLRLFLSGGGWADLPDGRPPRSQLRATYDRRAPRPRAGRRRPPARACA